MAYKVVRVRGSGLRDRFRGSDEEDLSFQTDSYPELDEYLSTMEDRGWTVVAVNTIVISNVFLYVTLHRDESLPADEPLVWEDDTQ